MKATYLRRSPVVFALALLAFASAPATAQVAPPVEESLDMRDFAGTGIGISASVPSVLTGLSVFRYMPDWGFGVFVTGRTTFSSPKDSDFFEAETSFPVARARDGAPFQNEEQYRMVSAGVIRAIDSAIALYAGAGYTTKRSFWEFWDVEEERGDRGFYWIEDVEERDSGLNVTGGVMIQIAQYLFVKGGGELFPRGANISVYVAFPY